MKLRLMITVLLVVAASVAGAECSYDGHNYPEGSMIGPYTCSSGEWVRK